MFLIYSAYIAMMICLAGIIYRAWRWLDLTLGDDAKAATKGQRLFGSITALVRALTRPRSLYQMIRSLVRDVILQIQILKQSPLRWGMHVAMFYGTLFLLVMHTFDDQIISRFFPDYASTLNPFLFLRNLLGLLVIAGVLVALIRRRSNSILKSTRNWADHLLLVLLSAIILTGVGLEATQIISSTLFDQMVEDYMGSDDPEEITPLKVYWASKFKVAFTPSPNQKDPGLMEAGRSLHEDFCAACHSRPNAAILSYPLALAITPFSQTISKLNIEYLLWYAHWLFSCIALALLPFGKLFHLITTPLALMIRSLGNTDANLPINRPTRRALALDACTHCGVCSQHCAVKPVFEIIPNSAILPSEKLKQVTRWVTGRSHAFAETALAEGSFICTSCGRCSLICPAGLDLADLWTASKSDLRRRGCCEPHDWMRRNNATQWSDVLNAHPDRPAEEDPLRRPAVRLSDHADTFWACVQCSTCTSVCPVAASSGDSQNNLDLTPQQVMNLMRLKLKDVAMGCRIVWDCVTCYKCQEHCPNGVRVADVLYELRNEGYRRLMPHKADADVSCGPKPKAGKAIGRTKEK